jgi:hypothetical protein
VEVTETQKEILFNAWALAQEGKGQVVEDWAVPHAHRLAEAGWLERRFEEDGELSWWWTREAETALSLDALRRSEPADFN